VRQDMAVICEDIERGNIAPSLPYPKDSFSRVLEHDKEGESTGDLKSTHIRLPTIKLHRYCRPCGRKSFTL
jgi:hypothetical protein